MLESVLGWLAGLPTPATYAVLMLLSALENVFPPVPADVAVAMGAFLAQRGEVSAPFLGLLCWLANCGSASATYFLGRVHGEAFFASGWPRRLLPPEARRALHDAYETHGVFGIFVNRFFPGVRAAVPPFAGVAGLGPVKALAPGSGLASHTSLPWSRCEAGCSVMGYLVVPLIIGIMAMPSPAPPPHVLEDFARVQRALNRQVYVTDTSGQERVVTILGTAADVVTVSVGRQWMTMHSDTILAMDRVQDRNRDGVVKGVLVGLVLGAVAESIAPGSDGRYLLRGAVTYGALGFLFDRGNVAREPLYRAP